MANKNYQIAKLYAALFELQNTINWEIIPMATHIGLQGEDPELYDALQAVADRAEQHLGKYELSVAKQSEV